MALAIKNLIIAFFTAFFTKWLEDFLIFVGLGMIVINTYFFTVVKANILAGNYVLGLTLLIIGIALAKK